MRKFVAAVVALFVSYNLAAADDFLALIKKVDGHKLTIQKLKKGEKGEEMTVTAADNVKVVRAKYNKEKQAFEAGDAIEGGLKNEMFSKGDGVVARITTDNSGNVTEIGVTPGFGKKGKKGGGGGADK